MAKTKINDGIDQNPNIELGNVELDRNEFAPENCKFRMTMWVDQDVLNAIRAEAAKHHLKYQTYLNQRLKEIFLEPKSETEFSLQELRIDFKKMQKIVAKLLASSKKPRTPSLTDRMPKSGSVKYKRSGSAHQTHTKKR